MGRGVVVVPRDFIDLGKRAAVDKALSRLVAAGSLRRIARGLYDYPRKHPKLGVLWPSVEAVTAAISDGQSIRLQPAGAHAANLLGISEQVPAKVVFLTDGPSRNVTYGPMTIRLVRTTPRNLAAAGRISGLLIQALRYLGKQNVTPARLAHLRSVLPEHERRRLAKDIPLAPAWMHPLLRDLAGEK